MQTKRNKFYFRCLLLPPSELWISTAKANRVLLKVVFSGTLLQAAAHEVKLPTENKYVLLLNWFLSMHCI